MTKQIELTQGKVTLVSDHRFEYLSQWNWHALFNGKRWYAVRKEGLSLFRKTFYMHREIMGTTNPEIKIDHWDGDGLNNQDENLRECTTAENGRNRGKTKNNTTGFKGVNLNKQSKKFRAEIWVDGKKICLGSFTNIEDAALAYNEAAKQYHGEFAYLNEVQP